MNRIKELRISLGLTQFNLGKKIGLNQTAIGKYERGQLEPSLDTLKKLALLFECSIDYIIGFTDDFGNVTIYIKYKSFSINFEYSKRLQEKSFDLLFV